MLFHALTGQPPFPDKNLLNTVMRHATEPPRPLASFISDVPDGLQSVMNWLLAKDPAQRYPTPERAAQALQLFLRQSPERQTARPVVPAYSRWLESSPDADTGKPPVVPINIPVGKLETASRKAEPVKPPEAHKPGLGPTVELPASPTVAPLVTAPVAAISLASFDVELIPVPLPAGDAKDGRRARRGLLELNRRDAIMLVAGAALVILAILVGFGLSKLLGHKPPPEPPAAPTPNEPPEG